MSLLAVSGLLAGMPASAAGDELRTLREEIAQMRKSYEQCIDALEARLAVAERAAVASHGAHAPQEDAARAGAFNPEIGLVLQGQARKMQAVPERTISGYWSAGHAHDGDTRGLALDHSELSLAANIDPHFRGLARFAITAEGGVEVEEASVTTLGLGRGITVRAGRFASALGYQNSRHRHEWDFADASLMQQVLFGGEGYRQDGVQVKWLAPTDFLFQLGAEIGRGAGFPGSNRNKNGAGAGTVFAKLGGDIGHSQAWQAGLDLLETRADRRGGQHFEDINGDEAEGFFSGRSRTAIADFVWKWAPQGNARTRHLAIQGEVFRREENGRFACDDADAATPTVCNGGRALGELRSRQSGGYLQAVWQFMPQWRLGYRHDWLNRGDKAFDAATVLAALDPGSPYFAAYAPRRASLMVDWSPSEFSRLRLQFARDRAMQGVLDHQVTLQYIMNLGAHGAHVF